MERKWPELLTALVTGEDLSPEETDWAMDQVMRGDVAPVHIAGLLIGLRAKGETVGEIEGFTRAMRRHAVRIRIPGPTVDIVGTGGDGSNSVNVSTMSAVVAAGAGAKVVKHGNRSASSASGSADVLRELGISLDLEPADVVALAEEAGITFCFAPRFHPAMRHASGPRRELGVRTVFNVLGPLTNPADVTAHAIGVADPRMAPLVAGVLARRGASALVFRGDDGLDELSVSTTSRIWSVAGGEVREERFDPREIGIALAPADALRGGDARHNAQVARDVFAGARGPVQDAVVLSAAAGLAALEASSRPVAERLAAGVERARAAIDTGAAASVLGRWVALSSKLAPSES